MQIIRLVVAAVIALVAGGLVNGGLVALGHRLVPLPDGVRGDSAEALAQALPLLNPQHFLFPFLAHAAGTFVSALIITLISKNRSLGPAMFCGILYLAAGTYMVVIMPAPLWFECVDLLCAYLPMAWLGRGLALRINSVAA
jgi:hypothetical protein